jgi:hypothetical protein
VPDGQSVRLYAYADLAIASNVRICPISRASSGMMWPCRSRLLLDVEHLATHGGLQQTTHTDRRKVGLEGFVDRRRDAERRGRSGERARSRPICTAGTLTPNLA